LSVVHRSRVNIDLSVQSPVAFAVIYLSRVGVVGSVFAAALTQVRPCPARYGAASLAAPCPARNGAAAFARPCQARVDAAALAVPCPARIDAAAAGVLSKFSSVIKFAALDATPNSLRSRLLQGQSGHTIGHWETGDFFRLREFPISANTRGI
jgi:hypothetical protein